MAAAADGAGKFSFSIDRGGTFTDVYAATPKGTRRWRVCLLSIRSIRSIRSIDLQARGFDQLACICTYAYTRHHFFPRLPCAEAAVGGPRQLPRCAARGVWRCGWLASWLAVVLWWRLRGGATYRACIRSSSHPPPPPPPHQGIRRVLEQETGTPHPRNKPLDTSRYACSVCVCVCCGCNPSDPLLTPKPALPTLPTQDRGHQDGHDRGDQRVAGAKRGAVRPGHHSRLPRPAAHWEPEPAAHL